MARLATIPVVCRSASLNITLIVGQIRIAASKNAAGLPSLPSCGASLFLFLSKPDQQRTAVAKQGGVAGSGRHAVSDGQRFAHAACPTLWIHDTSPAQRAFCSDADSVRDKNPASAALTPVAGPWQHRRRRGQ
jgi:hypothetical protein